MKQVSAVSAVTSSTSNRARRGAVLLELISVAEWWKNGSGQSIRARLSTYDGRNLIDLHLADALADTGAL